MKSLKLRKAVKNRSGRRPDTPSDSTSQAPSYRRNRTITDRSTSPEVSERARIHHLRAVRRKIGLLLLGIGLVAVIVAVCVSQFSGSVKVVSQSDVDLSRQIDVDKYVSVFDEYFSKHPLERFRFFTDIRRLTLSLHDSTPEVLAVESHVMDSVGISSYELSMRRPVASWVVDGKRYYVDADGVTFNTNYYTEPRVSVVDNSGAQVVKGAAIASSRLLSFVGRVVSLSASEGIIVTSIEIPTNSMRQLNVKGKGIPMVKMTIDKSVEGQVADMVTAISHFKSEKASVRYIDVRAAGRVYYK